MNKKAKKKTIYDYNLKCLECKNFCKVSKNEDVGSCPNYKQMIEKKK